MAALYHATKERGGSWDLKSFCQIFKDIVNKQNFTKAKRVGKDMAIVNCKRKNEPTDQIVICSLFAVCGQVFLSSIHVSRVSVI